MKWLYRILVFLVFMPVQTLILENMRIGGIKPDLALVLVFVQGWAFGEVNGLFWGMALGSLVDFFSTGILGVNFILKVFVGFVSGILGKSLLNLALWVNSFFIFIISVLHDVLGEFILHGVNGAELNDAMGNIIARAFYNSVLAMIFFFIFLKKVNTKGSFEYAGALLSPGRKSGFTK
ncbi:MAG TPA: rod shape-determining protein MreD [Candidatus Manganitrophaceae bacterium]|nr:rod shape-determining protein MreD [Candidatus Manganitrophaceae bacterium]